MPAEPPSSERFEDYTQLWTGVHNRVHALLLTLVTDPEAARDLTQEVSVVLWRKFEDYQEGTNFFAWAAQVARFHAMNWRRHHSRRGIPLSDGLLDKLATEAEIFAGDYDVRVAALRKCLHKLPDHQRQILEARYRQRLSANEIAGNHGTTARAVYKTLKRAHATLARCINHRLEPNPA